VSHVVHLGDCIEGMAALPDKSVDVLLADPPFSERVHARLGREGRSDGVASRDALSFGHLTRADASSIAGQAARAVRRWVLLFCDELAFPLGREAGEAAGLEFVRLGAWVKTDAMPQMSGDRPAAGLEFLAIFHAPRESGRMKWNAGGRSATWTGSCQEHGVPREHPAQKPIWLCEALVRDFTDPGELILDPFAGSGTTGVACKRLGRRFIGFERDPKYHAIAERRIRNAREQLGLWDGAA
jgi:site-specific DNA-methyltransferase (adenine-specific)